jgi:CIC family chloride channel protein
VLAVIAVGIACGLVGALMLVAIRLARTGFARLHASIAVRMTLGGLIVGLILTIAPDVAGNGFAPISTLLSGGTLAEPLLMLLALKILATAATIGSGAIGGLFTPALLLGALTALAGAPLLAHATGLSDMTVMLGVVGMAATLGATTHAPLMSTLMVFEMTQEPAFIFPLMLATIVAYVVSNMLGQNGVYAVTAHHFARYAMLTRLHDATAGDLMRPAQRLVPHDASLRCAREAGLVQKNRFVFLVAPDQTFAGTVSMHDLMLLPDDAASPRLADMANVDFPVVYAGQKLVDVWETVIESPAERTPVLSDPQERRVVGMLWKSDLLKQAQRLIS